MSNVNSEDNESGRGGRRRGIIRTALVLGAIVFLIYLAFIAQAVINH